MQKIEVELRSVAEDGLPDMDSLSGRVAFLFDGCVVSGWPLVEDGKDGWKRTEGDEDSWEGDSDVANSRPFYGVTHYLVFSQSLIEYEHPNAESAVQKS